MDTANAHNRRRVRFGRIKPIEFKWDNSQLHKTSHMSNLAENEAQEAVAAASFVTEKSRYDKFLNPSRVHRPDGTREACGKWSLR